MIFLLLFLSLIFSVSWEFLVPVSLFPLSVALSLVSFFIQISESNHGFTQVSQISWDSLDEFGFGNPSIIYQAFII